jgi:hypothetical protein
LSNHHGAPSLGPMKTANIISRPRIGRDYPMGICGALICLDPTSTGGDKGIVMPKIAQRRHWVVIVAIAGWPRLLFSKQVL